MKARDIMTSPVVTVAPETTVSQAAALLVERRIGALRQAVARDARHELRLLTVYDALDRDDPELLARITSGEGQDASNVQFEYDKRGRMISYTNHEGRDDADRLGARGARVW